jgi:hypothetical protein
MNVARMQKSRVAATVSTAVAAHQVIHFDVRFKNRGGLSRNFVQKVFNLINSLYFNSYLFVFMSNSG